LIAAAVLVLGSTVSQLPARTWTDSTGEYTVEADFVELKGEVVRLEKKDGRLIDVPLQKLSDADKAWVRNRTETLPKSSAPKLEAWPLTGQGDWKPPAGKAIVHLRCTVTTQKGRVMLGKPDSGPKDADAVAFADFVLTLPDGEEVTASAIGETVSGATSPTFRRAPSGRVTLSNFNEAKSYEWDVHLLFLIPEKTSRFTFRFAEQDAVPMKLPAAARAPSEGSVAVASRAAEQGDQSALKIVDVKVVGKSPLTFSASVSGRSAAEYQQFSFAHKIVSPDVKQKFLTFANEKLRDPKMANMRLGGFNSGSGYILARSAPYDTLPKSYEFGLDEDERASGALRVELQIYAFDGTDWSPLTDVFSEVIALE
jgi:hypothetical protein